MARISLDPPKTLGYRIGARLSRRRYGVMLDPGAAICAQHAGLGARMRCSSCRWSDGAGWIAG
jgi:hypothetical protein